MTKHTPAKLIVGKRLHIPKSLVPESAMEKRYHLKIFKQEACVKCDVYKNGERPNDICKDCPAYIANYKLFRETEKHWTVPQGDLLAFQKVLEKKGIKHIVDDRRTPVPFGSKIKWTGKLFGKNHVDENGFPRANQKRVVKEFIENGGEGIIVAPPRSGKTVMSSFLSIYFGNRTVILVHEKRLLVQFYKTFMGDKSKNRAPVSNIRQLQRDTGRRIILVAEKLSDLKKLDDVDILLINYQKMIHDLDRVYEYINGKFSTLILDEVHNSAATSYLRVCAAMNMTNRISLSATWRRKDNRHKIMARIQGPVAAQADTTSLVPTVVYKQSEARPPRPYKVWHHAISWLYRDKTRNVEILKQCFKDLRAGHEVIIIPVEHLNHQKVLVDMINKQAKLNREKRGEKWPKKLAYAYNSTTDKEKVLDIVDAPGPTVLIPIRKMVKEGIDFARPSMMYIVIPMSASKEKDIGSPAFYQLSTRICTPAPKPPPVVRVWIDNVNMFQSCIKSTFFQEVYKKRVSNQNPKGIYHVSGATYEIIKGLKNPNNNAGPKPKDMRGWA